MEMRAQQQENAKIPTAKALHPSFNAPNSKFALNRENINSSNRIIKHDADMAKAHSPNSDEENRSIALKSERSIGSYACVLPSHMEINYMQFIKGNREFRLITDAARAALLDDLCELDKCYYLNTSNFELYISDNKSTIKSKSKSYKPFRVYSLARAQVLPNARAFREQPVAVRGRA